MGSNLEIQHKIKLNTLKTIEVMISETAPLVGLQLGEKSQNFDSWTKSHDKERAEEKKRYQTKSSKGFTFHIQISFLKKLIFHSQNFPTI